MLLSDCIYSNLFDNDKRLIYEKSVTSCYCCGSSDFRFLFSKWGFSHHICNVCGFIFVNPRLTDEGLSKLYNSIAINSSRRFVEIPRNRGGEIYSASINREWMKEIADEISKYHKSGKLLDFGCGVGAFLKLLQVEHYNYDLFGTELNEESVNFAKNFYKLNVFKNTPGELRRQNKKFDIITLLGVLEHVDDPYTLLSELTELLNERGILYIFVPRMGLLSRVFTKEYYHFCSPPFHLNFFSKKSLSFLIKRVGNLEIINYFENKGVAFSLHQTLLRRWYERDYVVATKEKPSQWINILKKNHSIVLENILCKLLGGISRTVLRSIIKQVEGGVILNAIVQKKSEDRHVKLVT